MTELLLCEDFFLYLNLQVKMSSANITMISVLCEKAQQCEQKQRKKYTATLEQLSTFEVLLDEVYVDLCPKPVIMMFEEICFVSLMK